MSFDAAISFLAYCGAHRDINQQSDYFSKLNEQTDNKTKTCGTVQKSKIRINSQYSNGCPWVHFSLNVNSVCLKTWRRQVNI